MEKTYRKEVFKIRERKKENRASITNEEYIKRNKKKKEKKLNLEETLKWKG